MPKQGRGELLEGCDFAGLVAVLRSTAGGAWPNPEAAATLACDVRAARAAQSHCLGGNGAQEWWGV